MATKTTRKTLSLAKKRDSAHPPSFLKARTLELPYEVSSDTLFFDAGDDAEFSEWYAALVSGSDEEGCWDLASDVLLQGFKILVRVSAGNVVRVTAMAASRIAIPIAAAYQSETETLAFWAQKNKTTLAEEGMACDCQRSANLYCRSCGTPQ